ncbi:MAG: hypothetical protein M0002_06755 [Rhodospirillales bacterium]|nr:hypothetical protein [Rhodospirillales bacterium]
MRKLTLTALAAASLAGAGALAFPSFASAQPAAPPAGPPAAATPAPTPGMPYGMPGGPGPHPWIGMPERPGPWMMGGRGGPWMRGREMHYAPFAALRTWGLFHRPADLGLTPADVKIIGEAILLRHGQHDWKVGDVTANADNTVSFAFVTAHGDVVAHFAINTRTGRITRTD